MITAFIGFFKYLTHDVGRSAAMSVAVVLILAASRSLYAQTNIECSAIGGNWCLRLSEKEHMLQHSTDPGWTKSLESDFGRMRNNYFRNMPTLELTNTSDTAAKEIVKFEMTIGDTRFHFQDTEFGAAAVLGMYTPGYDLTSNISSDGNLLIVAIAKPGGGGLSPGETVHFRIDLGLDDGFSSAPFYEFPDFRTVLFDMNGQQHYGPDPAFPPSAEDNAQVTVHFSDGATSGPTPLADFAVTGPQKDYVNENFHRVFAADGVDLFALSGAATVIPEPGAAGLAIVGLLCSLAARVRTGRIG